MSVAKFLAAAVIAAGCGGDAVAPDGAQPGSDAAAGPPIDAAGIPPPPVLGEQLDRAGRPLIKDLLISPFADPAAQATARDVYRRVADPAAWKTTMLSTNVSIERELEANLAVFDAIDIGTTGLGANPGCGNALRYSTPPTFVSYLGAADLFADDELYLDTSKSQCGIYLSLEIEYASSGVFSHTACGGRTLDHDVVDTTYSVLVAGTNALVKTVLTGMISDGVTAHGDLSAGFPFLGAPH